jgi:curli biogenesis system outer membrane secretion channel CsgG
MNDEPRFCPGFTIPMILVAALAAAPVAAQDKAKPASAPAAKAKEASPSTKTLFENDKVKVMETRFKPGEGSEPRERPGRVVRALTDGIMMRTYPDGKTQKVEWKAGETKWFGKESFGNKNVGKTEMVLFIVETK